MKRLSTIFTVLSFIALSIIGCSKDDGGSDNNGNNSGNGTGNGNGNSNSGQTVAAITPDFLNGTWSHVEFEYDGVKFSNNANHQTEWNCVKKGSFVFTKNQVTLITNQYDDEDNTCTENRGTFNYTVENGKVYLIVQGKKELLDITKAGDNIVVSIKDEDGKTTKRIVEKDNEYLSTEVEKIIAEGDNTIALTATAKDYTVKIKVVNNGTAVSGKKVYATDSYTFQALSYGLKTGNGNENLLTSTKNATTNAQGIATFSDFRPTYNNQKYTFFVVTSSSPYYKEVELAIDGTAKESTITLAGSQAQTRKVNVEVWVRDSNEYLNNVKITIEGQTKSTNTIGSVKGYVVFELEQNKSFSYTATTPCGHTKTGSFTTNAYSNMVQVTLNTTENCNNQAKGTLIIKNNSKNPYTVKVGSSTFVMEGKTTRTFEVALETYTVSWKQNSGYAFYPTEGSYDAKFSRNNREITVSFP